MERVRQAVTYYLGERPDLEPALVFRTAILEMQGTLRARISPQLALDPGQVLARLEKGIPILSGQSLPVDPDLFRQGIRWLDQILQRETQFDLKLEHLWQENEISADDIARMVGDLAQDRLDPLDLRREAVEGEATALPALLLDVLVPFYEAEAARFHDQSGPSWQRGFCPFCGSWPRLSRLEEGGHRFLYCSLCRTEWLFSRLVCPFCASSAGGALNYLYLEGDRGHRTDVCENCRRYVKTCDERVLGRSVVMEIEDVVTARLDLVASEEGYR